MNRKTPQGRLDSNEIKVLQSRRTQRQFSQNRVYRLPVRLGAKPGRLAGGCVGKLCWICGCMQQPRVENAGRNACESAAAARGRYFEKKN